MENMHEMLLKNILIIFNKQKEMKLFNNIGKEFGQGQLLSNIYTNKKNVFFFKDMLLMEQLEILIQILENYLKNKNI